MNAGARFRSQSGDFADSVTAVQDAGALTSTPRIAAKFWTAATQRSGVAAFGWPRAESGDSNSSELGPDQSGDFADSVTALHDAVVLYLFFLKDSRQRCV